MPERAPKIPLALPEKNKSVKRRLASYGLEENQLPEALKIQLENYKQFRLLGSRAGLKTPEERRKARRERKLAREDNDEEHGTSRKRQPKVTVVSEESFEREREFMLNFLGWCVNEEEIPLSEISLELLIDPDLIEDYNYWSVVIRGNSHALASRLISANISVAKWLNYGKSKRKNWSDIDIITELQDIQSGYREKYEKERKQNQIGKWANKKITHEQARIIVQELRKYSSFNRNDGAERNLAAVAKSWEVYLLVKFLVYCPVRQQEIRGAQPGISLIRKISEYGKPFYDMVIKGKDFSDTGILRHYKLPSVLTNDLDVWLNVWLPIIKESVETPESWAKFWGFSLEQVERYRQDIKLATEGEEIPKHRQAKQRGENYIINLKGKLRGWENRLAARVIAQENILNYNVLFPRLAAKDGRNFGKPMTDGVVLTEVLCATQRATRGRLDIFGEEKRINPHAFRHIAEKHIRTVRAKDKAVFGKLIGHSEKVGDDYAEQITSEYELTETISDDWWEKDA